ncbi:polymorphic toxin-type HINT domain-containing protein, partial [Pseudomonas sp. PA15(2017)]|uniref:polymorphic toxin-type HINT domain-containing protein n=1 Tax=Pseudomonas sp. PA15(2017) TaxID=1932111 RepID=UPI0021154BEB
GKGDLEREGQRQQEAYLYAGDRLNFTSGRDTAISGAQLSGDEITGRVGRDLTVTSLADTGKVKGREFDVSATATFGPGAGFSASVGYGETTGSTEWVENQTRIVARDRLDIRTEEHTQLDGALIASNTGNLKLDTGTLGFSDIAGHDKEHSYYLNVGGSYGKNDAKDTQQDKSQEGKGEKGKTGWSVEGYEYEKDRQQIVRATVGEGEIVVRGDAQTGQDSTEGLNRDVSNAYEITRDDEERTDLYVTKSSVEAVASPIETLNQWKKDVQEYPERSLDALDDAVGLVSGVGKFAQQSWREIQAQQVSLDKVSPALRAQLGDEQALAVAKNMVRNGLNSDVINNFGENDLIVLAKFAQVYGEFNYEQAKCQASGGCRSPSTGLGSQSTNVVNEYGEKVPRSDDTVPLTAGEKLLLQSYKLKKYVSGLELEQAQLLMLGVQALMGPAKAAVGLAGNQLIASLFGDQIEKVKGDLALKIADQLLPAQLEDLAREHQKNKERHAAGEEVNDGVAFVIGSEFLLDVAMGSVGGFGRKTEGKVISGGSSQSSPSTKTITQAQAQKEGYKPCCFAAGTLVATPDGERAIESLKVGDIVWSKPEGGGEPFAAAVTATHTRTDQPIYKVVLKKDTVDGAIASEALEVTPGHPFYVPRHKGFVPVIDLKPGDRLQSLGDGVGDGSSITVESITLYQTQGQTYNLTVDVGHTFYVGKLGTWVHNIGPCASCNNGSCSIHAAAPEGGPKGFVGFSDDAAKSALSNVGRVDHSARHLIDAGIITANSGSKAARQAFHEIGQAILTNPTKTFDHVMTQGGQAVKGFYGKVNGSDVVIFVAKEPRGKIAAGDIVTAIKPSAQQMKNFGL